MVLDLTEDFGRHWYVRMAIQTTLAFAVSYYGAKAIMKFANPNYEREKEAKEKLRKISKALNLDPDETLSEHETLIAAQLVAPDELKTTWQQIGGLSSVMDELHDTVYLPLTQALKGHTSDLIKPPKGVLLYGPPGCGKTMVAKAVASHSGIRFLNLDISLLTDKYFGESQKLCKALFTVAEKVAPCIIFIDEIDSFLRTRSSSDNEATGMMKSIFLHKWDGLSTDDSKCVIVLGATNRRHDLDEAFLRRMPVQIKIPLPNLAQREHILELILCNENLDNTVDLKDLAKSTEEFSGSDLRELCRSAAISSLKNHLGANRNQSADQNSRQGVLTGENFSEALAKVMSSNRLRFRTFQ